MLLRQCSNKALSSTKVAQEPLGNLLRNLKHAAIFGLPLALLKALAFENPHGTPRKTSGALKANKARNKLGSQKVPLC